MRFIFYTLVVAIYLVAWFMQANLLIKGDVVWLFHLAEKVLDGGKYVQDFFEINPPLSIYVYLPAVFISKLFLLSPIHSAQLYIFVLSFCSFYLCYIQTNKLFSSDQAIGAFAFLSLILIIYLILPESEFGQRENIMLMLTLPYFLSVACRLQNKPLNSCLLLVIGLLAGIGFAIKPFYVISLLFVESYYLFAVRKFSSLIRPETLAIVMVVCFYLCIVAWLNQDYLHTVIPIATLFYYKSFASSFWNVWVSICYYCLFAIGLYWFQRNYLGNMKSLLVVILLAMSGFLVGYLLQRIPWYYHIYPAFSLAILYFGSIYYAIIQNLEKNAQLDSSLYFLCIAMWLISSIFYMVSSFLWYELFFLTAGLLFFSYFAKSQYFQCSRLAFSLAIAMIFFTFPGNFFIKYYQFGCKQKSDLDKLIILLHAQKDNKSIYFFSSMSAYMVSVLEHAHVRYTSRLQFLSWMRCLYNYSSSDPDPCGNGNKQHEQVNAFFINMLVNDINKNKPDWILTDEQSYHGQRGVRRVDYLGYLMKYPSFQSAFAPYHYITTVKNTSFPYEFKIYSRIAR